MTVQFGAILLVALSLVPGGAHLLELPAKMRLDREDYLVAQRLYRGWALSGIPLVGALVATLWLAVLSNGLAVAAAALACFLLGTTLLLFLVWIRPVNLQTHGWSVAPPNWQALRGRWEFGHAVNAVLTLAALAAAIVSVLADRIGG